MSNAVVQRLTSLRGQEQGVRSYATSSRWYTGTSLALSYLEQGLGAASAAEAFRNAWYAIYNLYMITHARGDTENTTMSRWAGEIHASPAVRKVASEVSEDFLRAVLKAKNSLLFDAEKKRTREALTLVEGWLKKLERGQAVPHERACKHLFLIGRDLRNALSHPTLDVNSANTRKALRLAADIFLPLAAAAVEATIEHPPAGSTGRATAYRSFLYPFLKNSDSVFSDYYLERLFPEEELAEFPEEDAKQRLRRLARAYEAGRGALSRADAEATTQTWCEPSLFAELGLQTRAGVRIVADDGVFEPTRVIARTGLVVNPGAEYRGREAGRELACLVWVLPWNASLDSVSRDEAFPELTLMEVAQRALARADVEWAVLTNGQRLRLLSKRTAHKARSFLEIDLAAVLDRWVEPEAQLAFRYTLGLFSHDSFVARDEKGGTRLDRAVLESERHGREISDELKRNVFGALDELGQGFLEYLRANPAGLEAWRARRAPSAPAAGFLSSDELLTDVYHESLSLMYRLLFLFYAESRDLLPMENDTYRDTYSLESIRDDIIATHDDPDPTRFFSRGATDLWDRLKELFTAVNGGLGNVIPAYDGGLFDPAQHQFLELFKVDDYHLALAIDLLSRTRPGAVRGEGRKKVTYRDLDIRHLGSIYEGILEYHAEIADQEKAVVRRGAGGRAAEEYVNVSELKADERQHLRAYREAVAEDAENPRPPRGCKVTGLVEPGEYYLIYGGRESKRKSSGSYYTPDYVVQYIVENTLGPLVRGERRPGLSPAAVGAAGGLEGGAEEARPLTSDEILELKVLDPAMGSGHFLVAATEYLARAYGAACAREGKDPDGVLSDDEFVRYKRMVAERCIYGVDINPMAVELAKLSVWLFTMDRGRPLSFLNHHLKAGSALVGSSIRHLGSPPEIDAGGRPRRRGRKDTRTGNLFEVRFREKLPEMVSDLFEIMDRETLTIGDVEKKKSLDRMVDEIKRPFKNIADIWVGLHFGEAADDYNSLLLQVETACARASDAARRNGAFHWEIEFPEVFFDRDGRERDGSGFSAIIGNPPYGLTDPSLRGFLYQYIVESSDIYAQFLARLTPLLSRGGVMTLIVSDTFRTLRTHFPLRKKLIEQTRIRSLCLMPEDVFRPAAATVVTTIISLSRDAADRDEILLSGNLRDTSYWVEGTPGEGKQLDIGASAEWSRAPYEAYTTCPERFPFFVIKRGQERLASTIPRLLHLAQTREHQHIKTLYDIARPIAGLQTGNDPAYCHVIAGSAADREFNAGAEAYPRIKKSEVARVIEKAPDYRRSIETINERAAELRVDRRELLVEALTKKLRPVGGPYVGFPTRSEVRLRHYYAGPPNFYIRWDEATVRDLVYKRRGDSYLRNPEFYFDETILTNASGGMSRAWVVNNSAPPNTYAAVIAPPELRGFLLGLLNGRLFWEILVTFMNSTLTGMASHVTPQDLRDFPVVVPDDKISSKIDALVDEIMRAKLRDPAWDHTPAQTKIDQLIESVYIDFL